MMATQTLISRPCIPYDQNTAPMTDVQIENFKLQLFGWDVNNQEGVKSLSRTFKFASFAEVLLFADKVREKAEMFSHYPRITVAPDRAMIEWHTSEIGGLHENDFIMAAKTGDIYDRWDDITGRKDSVEESSENSFPASDPPPVGSRIE